MDDYPDACKRFCALKRVVGDGYEDFGEAPDIPRLWQQVRALQLQLKGLEEKVYQLADTLYQHEHGGFKA